MMHNPASDEQSAADTIYIEDETLRAGFAQVPNRILRMRGLSHGARLTYALLLSYAWQKGSCFPGQERLAEDLDVSRQSVSTYLKELKTKGLIIVKRRGLGQTNIYILPRLADTPSGDPPPKAQQQPKAETMKVAVPARVEPGLHPDVKSALHQDVDSALRPDAKQATDLDVKPAGQKKEPVNKTSKKKKQEQAIPVTTTAEPGSIVSSSVVGATAVRAELASLGLSSKAVTEFERRYSAAYLLSKCEYVRFLIVQHSSLVGRNPAGYLRRAIEEDYAPPVGYAAQHQYYSNATNDALDDDSKSVYQAENTIEVEDSISSNQAKATDLDTLDTTLDTIGSGEAQQLDSNTDSAGARNVTDYVEINPDRSLSAADRIMSEQLDSLLANDKSLTGMPYQVYFKGCQIRRQGAQAIIFLRHAFATREVRSRYKQRCLYLIRRLDPNIADIEFEAL